MVVSTTYKTWRWWDMTHRLILEPNCCSVSYKENSFYYLSQYDNRYLFIIWWKFRPVFNISQIEGTIVDYPRKVGYMITINYREDDDEGAFSQKARKEIVIQDNKDV